MEKMKDEAPIIWILTVGLILVRIMMNKIAEVVLVVAIINIVALLGVILIVVRKIVSRVQNAIEDSGVPIEIQNREKNDAIRKFEGTVYASLLLFVVIYLIFWKSGLGNDIISIVSLGLSLTDVTVVDIVSNYILKKEKVL